MKSSIKSQPSTPKPPFNDMLSKSSKNVRFSPSDDKPADDQKSQLIEEIKYKSLESPLLNSKDVLRLEISQADDYDRAIGPDTLETIASMEDPNIRIRIYQELDDFKSTEMHIHPQSTCNTLYHNLFPSPSACKSDPIELDRRKIVNAWKLNGNVISDGSKSLYSTGSSCSIDDSMNSQVCTPSRVYKRYDESKFYSDSTFE